MQVGCENHLIKTHGSTCWMYVRFRSICVLIMKTYAVQVSMKFRTFIFTV